jgi:GNAT superfamily N-acetyltransferase
MPKGNISALFGMPIWLRLFPCLWKNGVARFRKFATRPDCQRQGVGTQLLNQVIEEARKLGAHILWCDARLSAADFYQRFGMEPEGDVFYKGPIPYSKYALRLTKNQL